MSLKDDIAMLVYKSAGRGETLNSPWDSADNILALLRERLLSEQAVKAGNALLPSYDQDTDAGDVIAAAFDAITGEQP